MFYKPPLEQIVKMDRKVFLERLVYACPMVDATSDCPIEKYRKSPIVKLIEEMSSMEDNDVLKITQNHVKCYHARKHKA